MKTENLEKRRALRYAFELRKEHMEIPKGKSKTVPGEVVEIRELINKSRNGMLDLELRNGTYGEDPDHDDPDLSKLDDVDFTEREELLEDLTDTVERLKSEIEAIKQKRGDIKSVNGTGVKEADEGKTIEPRG